MPATTGIIVGILLAFSPCEFNPIVGVLQLRDRMAERYTCMDDENFRICVIGAASESEQKGAMKRWRWP